MKMRETENGLLLSEKSIDLETGLPKIQELSDEELLRLYSLLKPVVTIDEMKYLLREFTLYELRKIAYTWVAEERKGDAIDPSSLKTVDEFPCLHTCGYYGFFKPSINEVLSQIPDGLEEEASYFEIVERPHTSADIFRYPELVNNGFQLSKVRAYKKKI